MPSRRFMYLVKDKAVYKGPRYVVWVTKRGIFECAPEGVRLVRTFRGSCEVWWYLRMKRRDSRPGGGMCAGLRETPSDQSLAVAP